VALDQDNSQALLETGTKQYRQAPGWPSDCSLEQVLPEKHLAFGQVLCGILANGRYLFGS
jgi:hypothetical protein